MKNILYITLAVILMASCASPKYTYNFDTYDYNSGRKQGLAKTDEVSPLTVAPEAMSASVAPEPAVVSEKAVKEKEIADAKAAFAKKYSEMSKAERREFRQDVKKEIKAYAKAIKQGDGVKAVAATSELDHDLKLAIIFGAIGLTLTLFGGINEAFWILGTIALVVGVVFLVMWLVRQ
jgi:hypothetical protein